MSVRRSSIVVVPPSSMVKGTWTPRRLGSRPGLRSRGYNGILSLRLVTLYSRGVYVLTSFRCLQVKSGGISDLLRGVVVGQEVRH